MIDKQIMQVMGMLFFLVTTLFSTDKGLAASSEAKQAIIVFIDGLSFADVDNLRKHPQMQAVQKSVSYGAMSIRTPGARTAENAYLLMGSGSQAIYTTQSDTAYAADEQLASGETAAERFRQVSNVSGRDQRAAAVLFPGIYRLLADNREKSFTERIGLLGSSLKEQGMRVTLLGNADYGSARSRPAALFAMDRQGEIAGGDVTAAGLKQEADYPFGIRTDYEGLAKHVGQQHDSGLTVIELGDLSRLYRLQGMMDQQRFALQYNKVMSDLSKFLSGLLQKQPSNHFVLVASSGVNPNAQKTKSLLLPVLMRHGSGEGNALVSYTTRQVGLVNGLDVLPTILDWFEIPIPKDLSGHVMKSVKGTDGLTFDRLSAKVDWIDHIYRNRSAVLSGYVFLQMIVLLVALAIWLWQKRKPKPLLESVKRPVRILLFSMLFYPGLFLLEPLLPWRVPPVMVLAFLFLLSVMIAAVLEGHGFLKSLLVSSLFTVGCILTDGFLGGKAISRSYLGYDPVIGARFYGLGNELEGVLIGAGILFTASVHEALRERFHVKQKLWGTMFACILFGVILIYMALPSLGANAGGFLAGAAGFGMAMLRFRNHAIKKRELLIISGILACGIGVLLVANLWSSQPLTHVGKVAQQIVAGNWTAVGQIIERKLQMNVKLIRVSLWSKAFFVSLIAISALTFCSGRFMRHLAERWPFLTGGFRGIVAGSLAGLVLNDSGIVSAATSIIFFVVPALYAALDGRSVPANRST